MPRSTKGVPRWSNMPGHPSGMWYNHCRVSCGNTETACCGWLEIDQSKTAGCVSEPHVKLQHGGGPWAGCWRYFASTVGNRGNDGESVGGCWDLLRTGLGRPWMGSPSAQTQLRSSHSVIGHASLATQQPTSKRSNRSPVRLAHHTPLPESDPTPPLFAACASQVEPSLGSGSAALLLIASRDLPSSTLGHTSSKWCERNLYLTTFPRRNRCSARKTATHMPSEAPSLT